MRSTQKKGPRTRAVKLMHAARRQGRDLEGLASSLRVSQAINAKWMNAVSLVNRGFDAHGMAADLIARAAGFGEPPEPEPATQNTPTTPPPLPGGAEACPEIDMKNLSAEELQRQHHEIARMAADAAGRVASHIPFDRQGISQLGNAPTPASAGKAVADAYIAALVQLSAGAGSPAAAVGSGT